MVSKWCNPSITYQKILIFQGKIPTFNKTLTSFISSSIWKNHDKVKDISLFLYTEKNLHKVKNPVHVSLYKKNISRERKNRQKGMENARTDAVFSL